MAQLLIPEHYSMELEDVKWDQSSRTHIGFYKFNGFFRIKRIKVLGMIMFPFLRASFFGSSPVLKGYMEEDMKEKLACKGGAKWTIFLFVLVIGALFAVNAQAVDFKVSVVDQDGKPIRGFKWLVEENTTNPPEPGVHKPVDTADVFNNTLAISIHKSHAPVKASGETGNDSVPIRSLEAGRYFVSVLPYGTADKTYDMGGAAIDTRDSNSVIVYVRENPIETAQISVKVFHDGNGGLLNNSPDIGEPGLAGVKISLSDQGGDISLDAFGNPLCGTGSCVTDANGEVLIKNLAPNKYGVEAVPPAGMGWHQVTTIEGTKIIDAWVRSNEPPFLVEFGPPMWHAFFGFTQEFDNIPDPPLVGDPPVPGPTVTVTGQVVKGHLSRPPSITFFPGPPPEGEAVGERCIVGLNPLILGFPTDPQPIANEAIWVGLCEDMTGNFTIPDVPTGTYQLVFFDISLLHIISFRTVIVNEDGSCNEPGGSCDLGTIATPMWFGIQEHNVLTSDIGIPEQNVNLRFRDGTVYQAFPTDTSGFVPFQGIFPFFHWQVAEVDFARFKATGLRVTNDLGGAVSFDPDFGEGKRNPETFVDEGTVLTQAFQIFAGSNQKFEWLKESYGVNENGGISGIVFYATTRAEDEPRFAAGEPWEPGIPRVQVALYRDLICNSNGGPAVWPDCPEAIPGEVGDGIADPKNTGATFPYTPTLADVDNFPLGNFPGREDVDGGTPGVFDYGDAIMVAYTDSWDDNPPTGCGPADVEPVVIHGTPVPIEQCGEGLRTWNQTVPGVFDGGYAFGPVVDCANIAGTCDAFTSLGADGERYLREGTYIVQSATPPNYKLVKEEDRNVDFGPTPIPAILPSRCVGDLHTVPPYMSFATYGRSNTLLPWADPVEHAAPFAGENRPLCDMKKVDLGTGQNAAAEFFLFTDVPKAARGVGLITDDLANELAPGKPAFTEKFSPGWISIAVYDYSGREIVRTYGDEFGAYNFMVPSTYAIDLPTPSGVSPKMHHFCLNHPGPLANGSMDPFWKPQYNTTCYTFNFEPARTTLLDTPVIRQAAFVGALQTTLDCEPEDGKPVVSKVSSGTDSNANGTVIAPGTTFVIHSEQDVQVPNPAFPGDADGDGFADDPPSEPQFITRDFGFGSVEGTVRIGNYTFPVSAVAWSSGGISVTVPLDPVGLTTGQLTVTRGDNGKATQIGVTMTVGNTATIRVPGDYQTIQGAIDAANDGDLILVDPGIYNELPIVYKRVRIQGAGAASTIISASHYGGGQQFVNQLVVWREKVIALSNANQLDLLPGQDPADPDTFLKDGEGPGFFVSPLPGVFGASDDPNVRARIDGFTIWRADLGGAIYVNTNGNHLQISNNKVTANGGNLGGGIRIGNPAVAAFAMGGVGIPGGSPNPQIDIVNNLINQNGSQTVGGAVALFKGADGYRIAENTMCGNLGRTGGGGIAHRGLSNGGLIQDNNIVFNEVFQGDQPGVGLGLGGVGGGGGGIELAGDPDPDGLLLTEGVGDVDILGNLLQGNLGGASDGGGIALRGVNGRDVVDNPGVPANWHMIRIINNEIINNVSGQAGGGISLQDAANLIIQANTIAHNDSVAVSVNTGVGTGMTTQQPAGVVSRGHNGALAAASGQAFSSPDVFANNIIYENRTFYWSQTAADDPLNEQGGVLPNVAAGDPAQYWDLGVLGAAAACLGPADSRLTSFTYPAFDACDYTGNGNSTGLPGFTAAYFNEIIAAAAADEGGNFVQLYYTPLAVIGDYADTVVDAGKDYIVPATAVLSAPDPVTEDSDLNNNDPVIEDSELNIKRGKKGKKGMKGMKGNKTKKGAKP